MKTLTSITTTIFPLAVVLLVANLYAAFMPSQPIKHESRENNTARIEQERPVSEPEALIPVKEAPPEKAATHELKPPPVPLPPYHGLILEAAKQHELDPALIRAVIMAESNCNPNAVSKRGAQGLMQLMPGTAAELGVVNSFDPAQNINGGAKYLRQLMDRFDNDVHLALAAYNAGSRYVRKYNGVPPFKATRLYIKKVIKYKSIYQRKQSPNNQMV